MPPQPLLIFWSSSSGRHRDQSHHLRKISQVEGLQRREYQSSSMVRFRELLVLSIAAIVFSGIVTARDFIVGDDDGWQSGIDYGDWIVGKVFLVGDKLVFKYTPGEQSVCEVNNTAYDSCATPPPEEVKTSGNDVFDLDSPGMRYFISGVKDNCDGGGQKVNITVVVQTQAPATSPTPAPSPLPAHRKISVFKKLVKLVPFFH